MRKVVVLTGAGISAESGLPTFRAADGLWTGHRVEDICTPEAWARQPDVVLDFYNKRRKDAAVAQPNLAHQALVRLESAFDVQIITQNVDALHERAESSKVLHLHGELNKGRSEIDEDCIVDWSGDQKIGDLAPDNAQIRPFIVFFGEDVPLLPYAAKLCSTADIFIIIGTSLQVYPASGLIHYAKSNAELFFN